MTIAQGSNSLADLAARIRAEHEAVSDALADSVRHAIAAGELLIEAKEQLKHGQWLPWLAEHCTISERTAQLYMRVAKNRVEIENQIRNGAADLSLNEAAALLMLSSDVRKLLNFAREAENLSGDALIDLCIANDVAVIQSPGYNPFHHVKSEADKLEWHVFVLFISFDREAGRDGFAPENSWHHVEYLLQKQFCNVDEWLGPEGEKWRRQCGNDRPTMHPQFLADWAAFRDAHRDCTLEDIIRKADELQRRFENDRAAGLINTPSERRRLKKDATAQRRARA